MQSAGTSLGREVGLTSTSPNLGCTVAIAVDISFLGNPCFQGSEDTFTGW